MVKNNLRLSFLFRIRKNVYLFLSRNAVRREEEEWRLLERAECREARDTDISLHVPQHAQILKRIVSQDF
jgi:hypothetical protein